MGVKSKRTPKIVTPAQDKPKRQNRETPLQSNITKWLKVTYPGIKFFSDFAAGLRLPPMIAMIRKIQACDGKYLDLTILKSVGQYHGLVIEIKVENDDLFLIDGITLKSDHVREQYKAILELREDGYYADFGIGETDIKNIISKYMSGYPLDYRPIIHRRG